MVPWRISLHTETAWVLTQGLTNNWQYFDNRTCPILWKMLQDVPTSFDKPVGVYNKRRVFYRPHLATLERYKNTAKRGEWKHTQQECVKKNKVFAMCSSCVHSVYNYKWPPSFLTKECHKWTNSAHGCRSIILWQTFRPAINLLYFASVFAKHATKYETPTIHFPYFIQSSRRRKNKLWNPFDVLRECRPDTKCKKSDTKYPAIHFLFFACVSCYFTISV